MKNLKVNPASIRAHVNKEKSATAARLKEPFAFSPPEGFLPGAEDGLREWAKKVRAVSADIACEIAEIKAAETAAADDYVYTDRHASDRITQDVKHTGQKTQEC